MDRDAVDVRGVDAALAAARVAAAAWGVVPVRARVTVIARMRRLIARDCAMLAQLLADRRPEAETLVTEVLPLAEAARFLERRAVGLLAPRTLKGGRPLWLLGVRAEIRREAVGVVLILAPGNYPLFLAGVQVLQALTAGNAVCIKPAPGCSSVMRHLGRLLAEAGLPEGLFRVLEAAAGEEAVVAGFDRIVLTGSAETGRRVLRAAADRLIPTTMELSGNDPVFVLPGADLDLVASSLAYGLRLNEGATCIAPRRVFVTPDAAAILERALVAKVRAVRPVPARVQEMLTEAAGAGARILGQGLPAVVADATPGLRLLREDVFASVLAIVPVADMDAALVAAADCRFALGASIFGPEAAAMRLADRVRAGAVVVNDVIVPTADPRLPFGGRGDSGFGVTRGAEGLLEMTVVKTISVRRGRFRPHLNEPRAGDAARFALLIRVLHGRLKKPKLHWRLWGS